jgi:chemotaxis protein CheX
MDFARAAEVLKDATLEVFGTMFGTELEPQAPIADKHPFHKSDDITALIGLAGDLQGYISIHCTLAQAKAFTARLLRIEPEEMIEADEIRDTVGEIVNMMAGRVKRAFSELNTVNIALPTVIMTAHPDVSVNGSTGIAIPFEDPTGVFHVELVVTEGEIS